MANHFHLLLDARIEDVSRGMRSLKGEYAREFNERYGRVGHLFQGRYEIRVLNDESHLEAATHYIGNNPVRIGRGAPAG
jgi:Transposase and inactivated derivatives